jgi:hypothetical protein
MALLGRIFVILFAFMAASLAAGIAIAIALLGPEWPALHGDPAARGGFWVLAMLGSSLTGATGILPLFLVIVLAESLNLRSVLFYVVAGITITLLGYYGAGFGVEESIDQAGPFSREMELAAAVGAVFGLVYWAIAGRKAGAWRRATVPPPHSPS